MAKNFIKPGNMITMLAAAAVSSGDFFAQGSIFGVAATSAAIGEEFELTTGGEWTLSDKKAGEAWAVGDPIYWDAGNTELTKVASTHMKVGVATIAAASAATSAAVRLNSSF